MKAQTVEELKGNITDSGPVDYRPPAIICKVANAKPFGEEKIIDGKKMGASQMFTLEGSSGDKISGFSGADRFDFQDYIGKKLILVNQQGAKGGAGIKGQMHTKYGPQLKLNYLVQIYDASTRTLLYGKDAPETLEGVEMPQAREAMPAGEKRAPASAQTHREPVQAELPIDTDDVLAAERMRAVENWAITLDLIMVECTKTGRDLTLYEQAMIAVNLSDQASRRLTSHEIEARKRR